jgi:hypothetical protein
VSIAVYFGISVVVIVIGKLRDTSAFKEENFKVRITSFPDGPTIIVDLGTLVGIIVVSYLDYRKAIV